MKENENKDKMKENENKEDKMKENENEQDKTKESLEYLFQKLGVSSAEEIFRKYKNLEEENQNLEEENQNLEEENQNLEEKNQKLRANINHKNTNPYSDIDSLNKSEFYDKMDEAGLIVNSFNIEDWNLGDYTQEDDHINKFCENIGENKYDLERDFQEDLKKLSINSNRLELYDSSNKKVLGESSDWVVKTKSCPLDPHHIHIVGDTRIIRTKQYTPDGTMIGQLMDYLKKLTNNRKKYYMFGFIIAPKAMIFIKHIVVSSKFQISDSIPIKEGLKLLKKLINMYNNHVNLIPTSLLESLSINESIDLKCIGGGASSYIFINGVVKLKNEYKGEKYIEISPYGVVLNKRCGIDVYIKALNVIKSFHRIGIIHRDIRSANIIIVKNEPIFIDWAFSTKKGVKSEYIGTLSTASDRILPLIKENATFSVSRSDELESLVKTFLLTKFSYIAQVIRSSERDPLEFLYNWNVIWNLLKDKFPVFNNLLNHAKKAKYTKMVEEFNTINIDRIELFLIQPFSENENSIKEEEFDDQEKVEVVDDEDDEEEVSDEVVDDEDDEEEVSDEVVDDQDD
ncbi:hypothetical protein ACTFIW_009221 [Dictyostelium discoideum]